MKNLVAIASALTALTSLTLAAPGFAQGRRAGQMFDSADTDHDGVVTKQEFLAARAAQFSRLDRNQDGYLDDADMPERMRSRRDANGGGGKLRQEFDKDGDGKVSKEEFVNGPTTAFDLADTNHDGKLDKQELEAAKAAVRERVSQRKQS